MLHLRNIGLALLLLLTISSANSSTMIEVNHIKYEIMVIEDSAMNLMDQLSGQIWWNDPVLAKDFANALYNSYGFPNFTATAGPIFAHNYNSQSNNIDGFICDAFSPSYDCAFEFINLPADTAYFFSRATPVPVPAAVWLFGSAILGLMGYSARKI